MSKSKDWRAIINDILTGSNLTLTVSGEINTGDKSANPELTKKIPQGTTETQLILEAQPVSESEHKVFEEVFYEEKIPDGNRRKYTSIRILVYGSDEVLKDFTEDEIEQCYS